MKVPTISRYDNIGIFDLFDDGEELWFTSIEYNALFKMNKQTTEIGYVGSFPNEKWWEYRLYTSVNEYKGKLFFTPCTACEIGVYDTVNNQFKKINIGISKQENDISKIKYGKKFVSGFIYNNILILIPCCYDKMVFYDIIYDKVYIRDEMFKFFYEKYKSFSTSLDSQFYLCWFAKKISETEIIFDLHCNQNIVVIYNLATREFKEKKIGKTNRTFSLIEYNGKYVFLYDEMKDVVIRWEIYSDEVIEYSIADMIPKFQACGLNHSFVNMVVLEDWLYLIPANTNIAVKINILTMNAFIEDALSEECLVKSNEVAYLSLCKVFDNKLYLFANHNKEIVIYEKSKITKNIKIELNSKDYNGIEKNYIMNLMENQQNFFGENIFFLNNFLDALINLRSNEFDQDNINTKLVGSMIYDHIKNSC